MRLEIGGGKTNYDGIFATSKYSTLSVEKSKISPVIGDIPIIIDITKGGVINRSDSFVWWMTKVNPDSTHDSYFKQSQWWEVNEDYYSKYKKYWEKFEGFYPRFRQSHLYEVLLS